MDPVRERLARLVEGFRALWLRLLSQDADERGAEEETDEATGPIVDQVVGSLLFLKYEDEIDAIEGWLGLGEGRRLAYLASTVPANQAIVELGSWKGKSTAYLAAGSKFGHRASVFAVDHWVGHPELQYMFPDPSATTLPEFLRNMEWQGHLDIVTPLSGKTSQGFEGGDGHQVDVVSGNEAAQAPNGGLEQTLLAGQLQELLGSGPRTLRPEAVALSSGVRRLWSGWGLSRLPAAL